MNLDEINYKLHIEGWQLDNKPYKGDKVWFKSFSSNASCRFNGKYGGIQIIIRYYSLGNGKDSFTIEIIGEAVNDVWINIKAYSLSYKQVYNDLGNICNKLIKAWEAFNENNK